MSFVGFDICCNAALTCFVVTISATKRPSATGSWLLWWSMKVMKNTGPTCVRSVSTNTCRQKEKNRCQTCSGDRWWKRRRIVECGKLRWKNHICVGCGNIFWVKRFRELADEERQAGIKGQWQQESAALGYLEQVRCCHDTDRNEPMTKKGFTALKNGT